MIKILLRSFKVINGSLWCHFRFDSKYSYDLKFHMNDFKPILPFQNTRSFKVIKGSLIGHFWFY